MVHHSIAQVLFGKRYPREGIIVLKPKTLLWLIYMVGYFKALNFIE